MEKLTSETPKQRRGMTIYGVGPKMTLILIPFIILFAILNILFYPAFHLPIDQIWTVIIGVILIIIGSYIFIKSEILIRKAYPALELVLTGFYGHMRHPMYGSFILFIIPGIVIITNSWIFYFIPLVFYILFRIFIKQEENYCVAKFGEKYIHYKKNVYAIIPKLKKYRSN